MRSSQTDCFEPLWSSAIRWLSTIGLAIVMFGCQGKDRSLMVMHQERDDWAAGQVIDARTGLSVPMGKWLEGLAAYDVIYMGEEHHNPAHIAAALTVLTSLIGEGHRPVLAMEMFGWDGQQALDHYLASQKPSRLEFLERSLWKQNWGGAFEDYEPLMQFAKDHQLPLLAMNPPKPLIRQVVKLGLVQAKEQPEWRRWGMEGETIVDDPPYRTRILSQIQECHGGGSTEDYQTMYEASMVRDEGMAKTVVAALQRALPKGKSVQGPVLSYTGGGHVQYGLPVPNRVVRRVPEGLTQVTVYMTTFEEGRAAELWQAMKEGIADYVWLTPQGSQGLPRRCR
ncbi:MAG: ChaN family lipoprotein [Nitrospira sp.]|nr:ChaN family lipoprotein [Nitrospira sp.]